MRHEVFKEGRLVQTQLWTRRLRWYYRHEFAMMLESVGFREVAVQCGYSDSDKGIQKPNGFSLPGDECLGKV